MPRFTINHGRQILHDRKAKHLVVMHDLYPENEVVINGVWCDIGRHIVSEGEIVSINNNDAAVCEGCYEHHNDK